MEDPTRPAVQPARKSGKAPSKDSRTGRLFEETFLLPDDQYPLRLPNMPRGKAINLSVGLNRCNKERWLSDPTAPKGLAWLSAKAKAVNPEEEKAARAACRAGLPAPEGGDWYVEISISNLRAGIRSSAREKSGEWMDDLLAKVQVSTAEAKAKQAEEDAARAERGTARMLHLHGSVTVEAAKAGEELLESYLKEEPAPTTAPDPHDAYLDDYLKD